jgi:hypothetical protein
MCLLVLNVLVSASLNGARSAPILGLAAPLSEIDNIGVIDIGQIWLSMLIFLSVLCKKTESKKLTFVNMCY